MAPRKSSVGQLAILAERITEAIVLIRGQKVMLDSDLASLYGVEPKTLNRAVKRNAARFTEDFMFPATPLTPPTDSRKSRRTARSP